MTAPPIAAGQLPDNLAALATVKAITDQLAKRLRCGLVDKSILTAKLPPAIEDIDGQTTIGGDV